MSINRAAVEADARLDGKFVLRTNTTLTAEEVACAYKNLWRVERTFREGKSTLGVRPIFHHRDDTSTGHIVACCLRCVWRWISNSASPRARSTCLGRL